jgi:hypothetical protein
MGVQEVIVLDVASSIAERPSVIVSAWESDQHTLTLIAIVIAMDHPMVRV